MPDIKWDWSRDYYHKDRWYGLSDWEACAAFVRALMENSEDKTFCWPNAHRRVIQGLSLISQTFIQHFGIMRDARGIAIIKDKLDRIGPGDRAWSSPWCREQIPLELLCLKSLSQIGGQASEDIIKAYQRDPDKHYLWPQLDKLKVRSSPRMNCTDFPKDYPEILKSVRGYHDVCGEGGSASRFDKAQTAEILNCYRNLRWNGIVETLSGDGKTTTFKLKNKITDHIHNFSDPFSDFGIFLSNPKIEYPAGRKRWSNSHTFLEFPIADGDLYGAEFSWDVAANTVTPHFHEHVEAEKAVVNQDGLSLTVNNKPISTGVELRGNVFSKQCTSAVRGVWDNPNKEGRNYYTRRANVLLPYKALYYFRPLHNPVVNQLGIWVVAEEERPERFFNRQGLCTDINGVIEQLLIPLHEPKILCWSTIPYEFGGQADLIAEKIPPQLRVDLSPVPESTILDDLMGVSFEHSKCGQIGCQEGTDNGYRNGLDINADGIIDEKDRDILDKHKGEVYRMNVGDYGYFGANWLSWGQSTRSSGKSSLESRFLTICSYDYGCGYEPNDGIVYLNERCKPGQKLYVEYYHDAPAKPGSDNVIVYLHPPIE